MSFSATYFFRATKWTKQIENKKKESGEREREREREREGERKREGIKSHPLEPIILSGQSFFFRKRADVSFRTGFFFQRN